MSYIDTQTNGYPTTEWEIRQTNPSTSFPIPFDASPRYMVVHASDKPAFDPMTHKAVEVDPVLSGGQWTQAWSVQELDAQEKAFAMAKLREAAKAARAVAVENIKVTTQAGNTFDGDETSQARMSRAILVLSTGFANEVPWVLADNTVIQADVAELTEALALAGQAQAAIWVI